MLEEFSGNSIKELLEMLAKDDDTNIKEELIYPYRLDQLDEEFLRCIFSSYRLRNDKYAALKISV